MKRLGLAPDAIQTARRLRRAMTTAERKIWVALREAFPAAAFRRQVPIGRYFCDFLSHRHKLVIEIDGGQHATAMAADAARARFLQSEGFRMIRFWNHDVLNNIEGVIRSISSELARQTEVQQ